MSEFGESIKDKKSILFRNPDGTFIHCYKDGEVDSVVNEIINAPKPIIIDSSLALSDRDIQYILLNAENSDMILEGILEVFRKYRIFFFIIVFLEMSFSCFLLFLTWKQRETSVYSINNNINSYSTLDSSLIFYSVFTVMIILNLIYYPFGYIAIVKKNIKILKYFSVFSLYSAIGCIFMIYINILIIYGFAKFLNNLLIAIVILPSVRRVGLNNRLNQGYNTI